jgi:hypothetical protein
LRPPISKGPLQPGRRLRAWAGGPTWVVVTPEDHMTRDEAADVLGLLGSGGSVNFLIARGILEQSLSTDGREGVTASSVRAELEWWQNASLWDRIKRRQRGFFYWFSP